MGHQALVFTLPRTLGWDEHSVIHQARVCGRGLTREDEQAVSMLTEGPFKPRVKEMRPQTTERVPDVAV